MDEKINKGIEKKKNRGKIWIDRRKQNKREGLKKGRREDKKNMRKTEREKIKV